MGRSLRGRRNHQEWSLQSASSGWLHHYSPLECLASKTISLLKLTDLSIEVVMATSLPTLRIFLASMFSHFGFVRRRQSLKWSFEDNHKDRHYKKHLHVQRNSKLSKNIYFSLLTVQWKKWLWIFSHIRKPRSFSRVPWLF